MPETLDTITITERRFEDIESRGADVRISLDELGRGARTSGRVATFRALLAQRGFTEGDITVQGVSRSSVAWPALPLGIVALVVVLFTVRSWLWAGAAVLGSVLLHAALRALKLGATTVTLSVRCADSARVGEVLDAALEAGATVELVGWIYESSPVRRETWAVDAIERANVRAARVAEALGVRVVGVHAYREQHTEPEPSYTPPGAVAPPASKSRVGAASISESLGTPVGRERAGVVVEIEYRVARRQG